MASLQAALDSDDPAVLIDLLNSLTFQPTSKGATDRSLNFPIEDIYFPSNTIRHGRFVFSPEHTRYVDEELRASLQSLGTDGTEANGTHGSPGPDSRDGGSLRSPQIPQAMRSNGDMTSQRRFQASPRYRQRQQQRQAEMPPPVPSYALPTKHFREQPSSTHPEACLSSRRLPEQYQQLLGDNKELKLRLQGQRETIHVLQDKLKRASLEMADVKKRQQKDASSSRPPSSCRACAVRREGVVTETAAGDSQPSQVGLLRRRAVVAEGRVAELMQHVKEWRAKEQRGREIGSTLKSRCRELQDTLQMCESEKECLKESLRAAERSGVGHKKEAKALSKLATKLRKRQADEVQEAESARRELEKLKVRLRGVEKERDALQLQVKSGQRDVFKLNGQLSECRAEVGMLQGRLKQAQLARRVEGSAAGSPVCSREVSRVREITKKSDSEEETEEMEPMGPLPEGRKTLAERYERLQAMYKRVHQQRLVEG